MDGELSNADRRQIYGAGVADADGTTGEGKRSDEDISSVVQGTRLAGRADGRVALYVQGGTRILIHTVADGEIPADGRCPKGDVPRVISDGHISAGTGGVKR